MRIKHVSVVHTTHKWTLQQDFELWNSWHGMWTLLFNIYLKNLYTNSQKSTSYRKFIPKKLVYFQEIPGPQIRTKLGSYMPGELVCLGSPQLAKCHWTWIQSLLCYTHCTFMNVKEQVIHFCCCILQCPTCSWDNIIGRVVVPLQETVLQEENWVTVLELSRRDNRWKGIILTHHNFNSIFSSSDCESNC